MTVKQLKKLLEGFEDDTLVMIRSTIDQTDPCYYVNMRVTHFDSKMDIAIISSDSPYTRVPFNVVEAGWRPTTDNA